MAKKFISMLFIICMILGTFTACLEDDSYYDGGSDIEDEGTKITITMSEEDFIGMLYTDAEAKLREMGFTTFEYKTLETDDINQPDDIVYAVEIGAWLFGSGDFSVGDTFDSNTTVVLRYYICNEPIPNLTAETCPDLAALLALKDPSDPSVSSFATKYKGQVIEFDGCVTAIQNHAGYKTRWDVMFGAGDYNANSIKGPNFHLTDVNYYDMNVSGGDSIRVGLNVRVTAEIVNYNSNTTLFELDIISIEIKD